MTIDAATRRLLFALADELTAETAETADRPRPDPWLRGRDSGLDFAAALLRTRAAEAAYADFTALAADLENVWGL